MLHVRGSVKVSHIAKRSLSCKLYKPWTPLFSQGVFWDWVRPMNFYMVSKQVSLTMMGLFPRCWTRVWPKMPHVRGRVKVSHIAKRSLSCRLYKSLTPIFSQGVFWDWVRPMDFYSFCVHVFEKWLDIIEKVVFS
jgi:uncharacterized membrane protein